MNKQHLPISTQITYAFGMMGWSMMINLISVLLIYFYVPPANSGLPKVITDAALLGVFNAVALITTSGKLFDVVFDPFIAQLSDKSNNPKGRRIPFMRIAIVPSFIFCFLVFLPLNKQESVTNIFWLAFTLVCFYVSTTTYLIPYNALLPEMACNPKQKVSLSSWQSVGYVVGIALGASTFNVADALQHHFNISVIASLQYTAVFIAFIAAVAMTITAFGIDEKKYSSGKPSEIGLGKALKQTLGNKNFRFFIVADFTYFIGLTIISSGLIYFITVLLPLPKTMGVVIMAAMVLASFIFYPLINYLSPRTGKKGIVICSLFVLALVFASIYFLGQPAISPNVQIFTLVGVVALPVAALNILPIAILADIIEKDRKDTGTNKEALYFAVRYLFVKIAQTFGIALFSMMLVYGKDTGHDFGIRLNGIIGFVLCIIAALVFTRFKDIGVKDVKA